jgi:hypothetical protein
MRAASSECTGTARPQYLFHAGFLAAIRFEILPFVDALLAKWGATMRALSLYLPGDL